MPESKHIHEIITAVVEAEQTIEAFVTAGDACCPAGPRCKRALALARTKLDEARQWLGEAQQHALDGI